MTSRMGIIGKRLVSVLSLVVTIVTFWAAYATQLRGKILVSPDRSPIPAAFMDRNLIKLTKRRLAGFFKHSHVDFLRQDHFFGHYKFANLFERWKIIHVVQH